MHTDCEPNLLVKSVIEPGVKEDSPVCTSDLRTEDAETGFGMDDN